MTLVTSLFNKGIYRNTLRRFKWGSFIYFIILFFSVPFTYMVQNPGDIRLNYDTGSIPYQDILFSYGAFIFPLIFAIVVPTVVALLVYNYIHSGKHSVFAHSLPVTRVSNYFSTILAAFTLMFLPVVANGLILFVMMFFGYHGIFSISSILYWIWVNIYIMFIMFSVATFASFLTGNSFAQVAINGIFHGILPLIALTIMIFSDVFLYGYTTARFSFAERLVEYTPFVWIISAFTNTNRVATAFKDPAAWIYFGVAIVFYLLTVLLCKKRRVENCGEVAGFKIMKPILKYTVTSGVAIAAFGILINADISQLWIWLVTAFLSLIAYFACEMVLSKSFKVFGTYKGYIAFASVTAAVVCFFAFTSVFGFETRIPDLEKIESATIYSDYHDEIPFSAEEASREVVTKFHNEFIKDIPVLSADYYHRERLAYTYNSHVYVIYNLKNGKTLSRRYLVPVELRDRAISEMFKFEDYKLAYSSIDMLNIDNIVDMSLSIDMPHFHYSYALNEDAKGLLKAIKKDLENITYEEYTEYQRTEFRLSLDMSPEENDRLKVFKPRKDNARYYFNLNFVINNNFKNAMAFLEETGYMELITDRMSDSVYISKEAFDINFDQNREVTVFDDGKMVSKEETISLFPSDCIKLEKDDGKQIVKQLLAGELTSYINVKPGSNYIVLIADNSFEVHFGSQTLTIPSEEIPEYLQKYVG